MSPDFKGIKSLRLEDSITQLWITLYNVSIYRDQSRGRLGQNSRPRGRTFALNGTQGEVGLPKNFFFFF